MKRSLILSSLIFAIIGVGLGYLLAPQGSVGAGESPKSDLAPRSEDEQEIIDVYRNTNESVVFITTVSISFDMFSGLQPEEGTGSGVIIDAEKGIILTNFHVIENAKRVEVSLAHGGVHPAKLLGIEPELDIAVLRLVDPPKGLVAANFGNSSTLEVGQMVIAIGNPFGLDRTLTSGIVSSLNRSIRRTDGSLMKGLIQTDAPINVGNSGGPLLDKAGRLIGINAAILSRSGDSAGIGFAVPINQIRRILPELVATGKVLKPDFGWILLDTDQGPMVHQVIPGSPAEAAEVQPILRRLDGTFISGYVRDLDRADLIVSVNGKQVRSKDEVESAISESGGGQSVEFELRTGGRLGESRKVSIKPLLR